MVDERKFILVETGAYFDTVSCSANEESHLFTPEWKRRQAYRIAYKEESDRSPRVLKYFVLESYEDTLNNLELKRTREQGELLERQSPICARTMYCGICSMWKAKKAPRCSIIDQFEDPFNYKLKIGTGSVGETRLANVDLVETFNWLLGLRVKHIDTIRGFRVVQGTNPAGEKALVIWRNAREKSNADLDEFFLKQGYNTRDMEFDLIYVNGDNNLENLKRPDETWKVRLIEEEFKNLMFDVEDV